MPERDPDRGLIPFRGLRPGIYAFFELRKGFSGFLGQVIQRSVSGPFANLNEESVFYQAADRFPLNPTNEPLPMTDHFNDIGPGQADFSGYRA